MKKIFILITLSLYFQSFTVLNSDIDIVQLAHKIQAKYKVPNKKYVTIIDYSKSIASTRLYLVDIEKNQIVMRSTVAHALNSGLVYPTKFSNDKGSNKSCLGAFKTMQTYYGKYGYSLQIEGLDNGINSNSFGRNIVFHSNKKMKYKWTLGCFATPEEINQKLIDKIKGGTLVYAFR